jgi:transcriptional regulator with XRE-family HTH domain
VTAKRRRRIIDPLILQLQARRLALGLTALEVGRRAGVNHDTIRHIEDGWSGGTLPVLRAYATAIGCDIQAIDEERQPDDHRT